jgi:hypothetical protein
MEAEMKRLLRLHQYGTYHSKREYLRLEGGLAPEEGRSSVSLDRFRPLAPAREPRFADDILGRSGELESVRKGNEGGACGG